MTAMVEAVRSPVRALPVVRVTRPLDSTLPTMRPEQIISLVLMLPPMTDWGPILSSSLALTSPCTLLGHKLHIAALHVALDVGKELDVALGEDVALEDACDLHITLGVQGAFEDAALRQKGGLGLLRDLFQRLHLCDGRRDGQTHLVLFHIHGCGLRRLLRRLVGLPLAAAPADAEHLIGCLRKIVFLAHLQHVPLMIDLTPIYSGS